MNHFYPGAKIPHKWSWQLISPVRGGPKKLGFSWGKENAVHADCLHWLD